MSMLEMQMERSTDMADDPMDQVRRVCDEAGLPSMAAIYELMAERVQDRDDDVTSAVYAHLAGLTVADVQADFDGYVDSMLDDMVADVAGSHE